jgi:protoporphyrinogen oxidase
MNQNSQIVIIGAGVSGLICALELEKAGYAPTIIDRSDRIGGRVQTDHIDGFILDHGFQVLLTEYPAARKYLDFEGLDLKKFLPGAVIFHQGKGSKFGDPLRHSSFLFSTAMSSAGTLGDKIKVYKLAKILRRKNVKSIFQEEEITTLEYLKKYGFSDRMIQQFFRPFFAGIFLEPKLSTSSRMFEFVYKMFSSGHAALPADGMQAIPDQIKRKLTNTQFLMGKKVKNVSENKIIFNNGETMLADRIIIASDPAFLLDEYKRSSTQWKGCTNLYYTAPKSMLRAPIIGLIPSLDSLVNNFHYVTDILDRKEAHLLSVTVVKSNDLDDQSLIEQVKKDLKKHAGIEGLKFLKLYHIPRSLPSLQNIKYAPDENKLKISDQVYLAGDYLANGSLNAAMESGKVAAKMVLESIQSNRSND